MTLSNGTHNYTLTGALSGTTGTGFSTVRRQPAVDHQHRQGVFQRQHEDLERRYQRRSAGAGFFDPAWYWTGRYSGSDPAQAESVGLVRRKCKRPRPGGVFSFGCNEARDGWQGSH